MSNPLLDTIPLTPQQQKAARLITAPKQLFNMLYANWSNNVLAIWNDPNPQAVITALGTNAVNLFVLSGQLATFLESIQSGSTTAVVAKVKPFTANQDGTITVNA